MARLRQDYKEFVSMYTEVVVVGPEDKKAFKKYWEEHDLPFYGLPNPDYSILKLFGQEVKLFKLGRMPAQVIIDRNGFVRYAHYGKAMSDIPDNEELLDVLQQLNEEYDAVKA